MKRVAWLGGGLALLLFACMGLFSADDPAEEAKTQTPKREQPEAVEEQERETFVYANWDTQDEPKARRARPMAGVAAEAKERKPARFEGVGVATVAPGSKEK